MEINGFTIEKYNVHNLQENAKASTCPLCSENRKKKTDKCLSLFWDTGIGQCNHCGERIQLHTYKKKKEIREYKKPEWKNNTSLSNKVVTWFESRKISQFTLRMAKVTEGFEWMPQKKKEVNTIQFNYFRNEELINVKYRDAEKHFKLVKDAERILYNLDCISIADECIIVEGEIDCLSYIEVGIFNVVSIPNGSTLKGVNLEYIDNCIEYLENKTKIYLALDTDEAGKNTSKEIIRRLGAERCFLVDFSDCKDANEYLIKYGAESLRDSLKNANEVPIDGTSCLNDWESNFDEYVCNGMQKGFTTGKKSLDNIFSTYTGQFITVTGIPSSGKSDFVDDMCLGYNRSLGWKIAIASPENKPYTIHAGKIMSKICGTWMNKKEYLLQDWFKLAKQYVSDNFKYIDLDSYDLDVILEKTRSLITKYGIKVLVIDPYNKCRLKESQGKPITEYTSDYLLKIDEFCKKNDILIILIAHPNKPQGMSKKEYTPDFYSIKGGGEFYDMSPHGILVQRDFERDLTMIEIMKVKFHHLGKNGAKIWLKWNNLNGRYNDFDFQHEDPERISLPLIDNSNWIIEANKQHLSTEIDYSNNIEPNTNFSDEVPF